MRVTLIHNPQAGTSATSVDLPTLLATMTSAGHTVHAQTCTEQAWEAALDQPADVVAILGGDGTVGEVARRMIGRGVPLAALAAGTANNIAMTLGTQQTDLAAQVKGWADARRVVFDACLAEGPWGRRYLLEGLGCGLFTWGMRTAQSMSPAADASVEARLAATLAMLAERTLSHPTARIDATLDDEDLSGDYVLLEAMNTQFVGPNLFLAPAGHPGDGLLDVVTVADAARAEFREHLASWRRGALRPAQWPSRQGRHLSLRWRGVPLHLDDQLWPAEEDAARIDEPITIDVRVVQGALEFLVPAQTDHPPVP